MVEGKRIQLPSHVTGSPGLFPVPSAEVGVERLFSNARDVLGIRRHCLNAETFRWLMFLKGQYDKERQLRDV